MPPSAPLGQQRNDYPFHPLANIFPLLEGDSFTALVEDICTQGLREPIWLYDGQILDGRNRYRACQVAEVSCETRIYAGDDPVGFVVSMNLRRRHLGESQRGMVAARLANLPQGRPGKTPSIEGVSQQQAATLLNVGLATVERSSKVQHDAAPEVIQAVDAGELTSSAAFPLTTLPKDEQAAALEEAKNEAPWRKPTAKQTQGIATTRKVVTTIRKNQDAGESPSKAVAHALKAHNITTPSPGLADEIAKVTDGQVTRFATDGLYHDGRTKGDDAAIAAKTKRFFQLFNALEALATLPDLAVLLPEIPQPYYPKVTKYVAPALATLTRFAALWKEAHHEPA